MLININYKRIGGYPRTEVQDIQSELWYFVYMGVWWNTGIGYYVSGMFTVCLLYIW